MPTSPFRRIRTHPVDPHELSATIEGVDSRERVLGSDRFATGKPGYTGMLNYVPMSKPTWLVEGSTAGRPLAERHAAEPFLACNLSPIGCAPRALFNELTNLTKLVSTCFVERLLWLGDHPSDLASD